MTTEDLLKNLLAVIHRDGGHTTERLGLDASVTQAIDTVSSLRQTVDELETTLRRITERIAERVVVKWRREGPGPLPAERVIPGAVHPIGCMCADCAAARARG